MGQGCPQPCSLGASLVLPRKLQRISHSCHHPPCTCGTGDPKFLCQGALEEFLLPPATVRYLQYPQWDMLWSQPVPSLGQRD